MNAELNLSSINIPTLESSMKDPTMEECRTFLLYNFEKSDLVDQKWELSYELRQQMLRNEMDSAHDIILAWPIISKPYGAALVIFKFVLPSNHFKIFFK